MTDALFWHELGDNTIKCTLCYRGCELRDGEDGWCKYRGNRGGSMQLHWHGISSGLVAGAFGYGGFDALLTYKPGMPRLNVGGIGCTARCSFCCESYVAWNPDELRWMPDEKPNRNMQWHFLKARITPADVVKAAAKHNCRALEFEVNEPLLSYEFVEATAKLAKQQGLDVAIFTNGFSGAKPVRRIAPYTDAVYFGLKGSADPDFYARQMRASGAVPHVLEALKAWHDCGAYISVGDVLAAPKMQTDAAQAAAQDRLFAYLLENFGGTGVMYQPMVMAIPSTGKHQQHEGVWGNRSAVMRRQVDTINRAYRAGLQYVLDDATHITCHGCDETLLRFYASVKPGQPYAHRQFVTDGRCDHCGVSVPIVTLPHSEVPAIDLAAYEPTAGMHLMSLMGFLG